MNNLIIETSNLCKCYGVNMVVSHVNIHVQKGSIYGLLGRNGAGKTSIMKMMLGLTPITDGNITMFGMQFPANKAEILRRVGVMIETPGFYPNLTATELWLGAGIGLWGKNRVIISLTILEIMVY